MDEHFRDGATRQHVRIRAVLIERSRELGACAVRIVDSVEADAEVRVAAKVALARANVDCRRLRRRDSDGADGERLRVIEDGRPGCPAAERSVAAALSRADIGDVRVRGVDGDGADAPTDGLRYAEGLAVRKGRRSYRGPRGAV